MKRSGKARSLSLTVLAAAILAAVPASALPAAAASNGSFSIFPYHAPGSASPERSLFNFSLKAGREARDAFTLDNDSPSAMEFNIYPADAYDVTAGGGFALRGFGEKNDGVGAWIKLPASLAQPYQLAADSQVTIPFTVSVPSDASPGDHAGGIVALAVSPARRARSRVHFTVRQGVGVRVYLHVLGQVHPGLEVQNLSTDASVPPGAFLTGSSKAAVTFDVVNTGNTIYQSVLVRTYATGAFGQRVRTFRPVHLATVLPGSRETITEPKWSPLPFAGPVTVHVELVATKVTHKYSSSFWVVPWLLVVVVVLVVAMGAYLWRRRKHKTPPLHAKGRNAGRSAGAPTNEAPGAGNVTQGLAQE